MRPRPSHFLLVLFFGTCATLWVSPVGAQGSDLPGVAPLGGGQPESQQQQPAPEDMPETHAASGGTDSTLPEGNEPTLPQAPLEISERTLAQIGSDGDPAALGTEEAKREFYGLYYNEEAGQYRYRVAFPLWAERTMPSEVTPKSTDRASLYGGLYYNRRSPEHRDDIFFPVAWNLENPLEKHRTTVVGPFVNRRTKSDTDDWLLPVYATGTRADGGYTIIPPLLTYRNRDQQGGLNIVGPGFCTWKGGQSCDTRTAQDIELGLAPFFFFGQNDRRLYEVIPPLGHYYRYDLRLRSWTNIYGPYFRRHTEKREMLHLIPFYFSIWGKQERHTTVAPLFHYGTNEKRNLLVTPLFVHSNPVQEGHNTFVTLLYARHRGETELDMLTPLYWQFRDERIGLRRDLLLPFFYRNKSPRESTHTVFPFFSYTNRLGISRSLWITPLFNQRSHLRGGSTSLHPFFYFGKNGHNRHRVAFPLYFDVQKLQTRSTVIPPLLFVRAKGRDTLTQLVGPVLYRERQYSNGKEWQIHLLPLMSFGQTPNGHFWNLLFGLAGFEREGPSTKAKVLWLPIPLSGAY